MPGFMIAQQAKPELGRTCENEKKAELIDLLTDAWRHKLSLGHTCLFHAQPTEQQQVLWMKHNTVYIN